MAETFFITKYALSAGIFTIESAARTEAWHSEGQFSVKDTRPGSYGWNTFTEKEAFRNREEALADAEKRRTAKIASLEKQIKKALAKDFSRGLPA